MKRAFLVPAAAAVAALSSAAHAALPTADASLPQDGQTDAGLAAKRATIEGLQKPITPYAVGDQLFGFVIERNDSGEVVADHYSHSSHSSHASHASGS